MIIGQFEKGKKVLVIEDVVTTGASILETVAEINKVLGWDKFTLKNFL